MQADAPKMIIEILSKEDPSLAALVQQIKKKLYCQCRVMDLLQTLNREEHVENGQHLIMINCSGTVMTQVFQVLKVTQAICLQYCEILLFNAIANEQIEAEAISSGVKGVFYKTDSIETLIKGLQHVIDGEFWFQRKILAKYLSSMVLKRRSRAQFKVNLKDKYLAVASLFSFDLTEREQEILDMLVAGHSNQTIASELNISIHTVKAHVYNSFRKINVTSRVQAATVWTSHRHLTM